MKQVLLFLFTLGLLASCNSDHVTSATGRVYNINTNIPVPGAKVKIAKRISSTFNVRYIDLDSTTADSQGRFDLTVTQDVSKSLIVYAEKEGYFSMLLGSPNSNLNDDEANSINLYPVPHAWVKINYDQLDPNHGIVVAKPSGSERLYSMSLASDTFAISRIYGSGTEDIDVFYNVSGTQIKHELIPVQTGIHDTVEVNIAF
ncbi:hypothetical protein [Phaeocystidibacter luteus]|uniref:Carboxypeptidase regulatory-like domain-containing protein n=1 Tax=Phaeocystidibacter luteus TaxID=911197 RepID=A0A6N6RM68_9FLAO|nr:hypothetical protein [Phaeocystidibacter luteus]KAB2814660.1 hypothetical protein F8C67_02650 [Phaeocystidibacter luteus]